MIEKFLNFHTVCSEYWQVWCIFFFNIFRVYFAKDDTLDEKYLASTKENFLAEPVATDFGNEEEARNSINKWVEAQTNSKIKELIARNVLTPLTKLVLVNAIHFKGDWETKFDKGKS